MVRQIELPQHANDAKATFVFQLMTPNTNAFPALGLVVRIHRQPQLCQVLGRVPEVEDALCQREVLAEEFLQAIAAVR